MSKFRTKKNHRTTYIYKDNNGKTIATLRPGVDGVTEALIAKLHAEDDAVHNADKRDSYHGVFHYEGETISEDDNRSIDLHDNSGNPEKLLLDALSAAERTGVFKAEWDSLSDKQRDLVMKKLLGRSNVDIAAEEGCTEAAIRNRLAKIQRRFEKFLK